MADARESLCDEVLVLGCREGSREAFTLLVERWQARLWRHARRLTGRDDAASDVLQDAWLAMAEGLGRLDDPAAFPRWAYTIVSRRAADWQRLRRRDEDVAGPRVDETELPGPDDSAADAPRDAVELLGRALRRLPGERRALLSLHHLEGFDVAEIAEILGIPAGTVKSRLHHARQQLRDIIERMDR